MRLGYRPLLIILSVVLLMPYVMTAGEGYVLQTEEVVFDPVSITARLNTNGTSIVEFRAQA
ncbi:MAG: hypothetical protein KAR33_11715, partial [Candidatus Thorarchaeota archaeon]|nr:hypothetical protein [Candidatus Thorarchaeota archaeon]